MAHRTGSDQPRAPRAHMLLYVLVSGLLVVTGWVLSELEPPVRASQVTPYPACPTAT